MKILRTPEVCAMVGLARFTIWKRERAGTFPQRLQLGGRQVGWLESEILDWIASRPRGIGQG